MKRSAILMMAVVGLCVAGATADMNITEWMYSGNGGEFIEFTNTGLTSVDMTGWSYEDSHHPSNDPSYFDLSGFGTVAPGESVIITEDDAATFRSDWGLDASVKVLGLLGDASLDPDAGDNIGRGDTIYLLDGSLATIDVLQYGDEDFAGSIRTKEFSGNPISAAALGANDCLQWELSAVGDAHGSYASAMGDIGNPGTYVVPEPASLMLLAVVGLFAARRR